MVKGKLFCRKCGHSKLFDRGGGDVVCKRCGVHMSIDGKGTSHLIKQPIRDRMEAEAVAERWLLGFLPGILKNIEVTVAGICGKSKKEEAFLRGMVARKINPRGFSL